MRSNRRAPLRSDLRSPLLVLAAVALAGLGAALLWSSLREADEASDSIPPGMVGVPVAAVDLPAYTEIQLEHLLDPATGQLAAVILPEESILESTVVDPKDLVGRVLARKKSAARVFREQDFLPVGTRPGLVAGIPEGKRALRIDASKVSGIVGLQQGDRFDLVATYRGDGATGRVQSVFGAGGIGANGVGARARMIAENAAVVTALSARSLPMPGRGEQIVQEMVVALAPDEVPIVTEALELAKRIDCIPRSGLPSEATRSDASGAGAAAASTNRPRRADDEPIVDLIEGDRRSLRRLPGESSTLVAPAVSAGPPRETDRIGDGGG
ncbi:MAG: hypothetical protein U0900_04175 [Myxococcota bacterium]